VKDVVFNADTLHNMKSVSKSVASLAIGIAIDRGLIRSVNEPIFTFFPECADLRSPEKDRIQLVHVLTMTMGLEWVEATPATGENNDESRMHRAADPCRYVLGLVSTSPPGQEFFYNTGALTLASAIVHKPTGRPLDEFAREVLFEPLGIADVEWTRVRGDTDAGGGLRLRTRDMAKIGQLVLAGGQWNDRQIVSKHWIETSTTSKIKATDDQYYGYLWWLGRAQTNAGVVNWIGALGRGGQSIRIVPERNLVVAVTAERLYRQRIDRRRVNRQRRRLGCATRYGRRRPADSSRLGRVRYRPSARASPDARRSCRTRAGSSRGCALRGGSCWRPEGVVLLS
jgi:CubicO group peptidase (beta-lactamase class C family)